MIPLSNNLRDLGAPVANWLQVPGLSSLSGNHSQIEFIMSSLLDTTGSKMAILDANQTATGGQILLSKISEASGVLSLSVWLFAQLPQIIENHVNQSVSGVSVLFLMCWISGDVTNLMGCILTRALPFQTCLAAYYCFIDCILTLQFWYYTKVYPRQKVHHNLLQSPNMLRPTVSRKHSRGNLRKNRFEQDVTRSPMEITNSHYHTKQQSSIFQKILSASFMSGSFKKAHGAVIPITEENTSSKDFLLTQADLPSQTSQDIFQPSKWVHSALASMGLLSLSASDIGKCSAWLCSCLYLSSRAPQIIKNYRSKSTQGISVFLFLFAMLGNLFYTVSIVTDLYLLYISRYELEGGNDRFKQIFMDQLPFIVGSSGTILFDMIILFQCWKYKRTSKSRNNSAHSPHFYRTAGNHDNRSASRGSNLRRRSKSRKGESPLFFQKPDWYTNNHQSFDIDDTMEGEYARRRSRTRSRGPRRRDNSNQSHTETTSLLQKNIHYTNYMSSPTPGATPPPAHYISVSHQDSHMVHPPPHSGIFSNTMASLAKSFTHKEKGAKSPISTASVRSIINSGKLDPINSGSPLPTSLIPSIIGTYSSVSRKMSNDTKIPFSPSDFLHDDFYHPESYGSHSERDT